MTEQATSFGTVAASYERGRPPYPQEALDWLLPTGTPRVLDLGAGTGKLTRQIAARGLDVTAVDPSAGMLDQLARVLPGVPAHRGSAEHIPLPDHSVDTVLCAQAWHWVDPARAVPEVARVLAPAGTLGLVWNLRDERTDWVRRLGEIIHSPEFSRPTELGTRFGPVDKATFSWTHRLGLDQLLDLVASRSYVIMLGEAERATVLDNVRDLTRTHPDLAGRTEFDLPYTTECARATVDHAQSAG
ncbi:class I SAM-dependent methyltransferase [Actinoplanes sp. N902-109]|uniref:class I SAM-dependent methyltransferase n=1 Tax=Actinoplanes sp. (strain N902-109) TaxID=649831 RepID=UPI00032951EA|nr:class I SAM-dependent methyltransferase [Actinoplanes sp. N902-109]AGL17432.1 methyltransferase [Actinoplanes sp. N902-109]